MTEIKFEIPANARQTKCRSKNCGAMIYWIETPNGKRMPVDPDGTSHFATCPDAQKFRKYNPAKDPKRLAQVEQMRHITNAWGGINFTDTEKAVIEGIKIKFTKGHELNKDEANALQSLHEKWIENHTVPAGRYLARLYQNLKKPDEVDYKPVRGIDAVEAAINFVEENLIYADEGVIIEILNGVRDKLFVKVTTQIKGEYIAKDLLKNHIAK